jgi:hypothetical protein
MIYKEIFSKNKNQNFLNDTINKKLLNKSIYEKFYIRGSLLGLKNIQILDNNGALYNFPVQIQPKSYNTKTVKYVEGFSLNASSFFYRNKLNNALKFRLFILNSLKYKGLIDSFYNCLEVLNIFGSSFNSLMVLKPIKGGFSCYSSGLFGFLPRSHGLFLISKTLVPIFNNCQVNSKIQNLASLIFDDITKRSVFLLRLQFTLGKVLVYLPIVKQNNFSSISKKKVKYALNDYNFIFLSRQTKPNKITISSNEKIKKIVKK